MSGELYIRTGMLIDGCGGEPNRGAGIAIRDGRIARIDRDARTSVGDEAQTIDASAYTVLPGLIDAHVHIHTPGGPMDNYALAQLKGFQGRLALDAYRYALTDLEMGYTALRSLSSPAYVDIAVRDVIASGGLVGPRLIVSGQGLTATGGHMDGAWWSPEIEVPNRTGVCDGPSACRRAARTQLKWGADVLKINPCVGDYRDLDEPWRQEMTYEEIAAICEVAHWAGRRVAAHTAGGQGITDCLRAGVDSLEHAHWLTDEQIGRMAEQGTFYVPTLIVNSRSVEQGEGQRDLTPEAWGWLRKVYDDKWETLRRAKAAGVRIAAGTDAGFVVPHGDNASEIGELVNGGFTPLEAIGAATRVAAECLGVERDIGTIEAGKCADLVIVDGDPLADVGILREKARIVSVYRDGLRIAGRG